LSSVPSRCPRRRLDHEEDEEVDTVTPTTAACDENRNYIIIIIVIIIFNVAYMKEYMKELLPGPRKM